MGCSNSREKEAPPQSRQQQQQVVVGPNNQNANNGAQQQQQQQQRKPAATASATKTQKAAAAPLSPMGESLRAKIGGGQNSDNPDFGLGYDSTEPIRSPVGRNPSLTTKDLGFKPLAAATTNKNMTTTANSKQQQQQAIEQPSAAAAAASTKVDAPTTTNNNRNTSAIIPVVALATTNTETTTTPSSSSPVRNGLLENTQASMYSCAGDVAGHGGALLHPSASARSSRTHRRKKSNDVGDDGGENGGGGLTDSKEKRKKKKRVQLPDESHPKDARNKNSGKDTAEEDFRSFHSAISTATRQSANNGGGANAAGNDNDDDDAEIANLDDLDEMESAVEGEDVADPNTLCEDEDEDCLAQTVTIYHAGIEIDVIAAMMREGGEIIHHKPTHHQRTKSLTSAVPSAFGDSDEENLIDTDGEYEEDEEDYEYTDETVSVASEYSDGLASSSNGTTLATASAVFDKNNANNTSGNINNSASVGDLGSADHLNNTNNNNGGETATFRLVKRSNRAPSMVGTAPPNLSADVSATSASAASRLTAPSSTTAAPAASTTSAGTSSATASPSASGSPKTPPTGSGGAAKTTAAGKAPGSPTTKFQNIEAGSDPSSAAGQLISKRLTQEGKFDLSCLRPGADFLAKNLKFVPTLTTYDPAKDPRLATGEYEKSAKTATKEDPALLSGSVVPSASNSVTNRGSAALTTRDFAHLNASLNATMLNGGGKDYGKGRSAPLPANVDISSSWDLMKSIPNAVDLLNKGGILFRYQAKKWCEMTLSEKIEMGSFINLSQFKDEDAENDQPVIDFVHNRHTKPENDLTNMTVICARLVTIVPTVTSKDMNVDVLMSDDYQRILLASDEVLEKADRPRTMRKNKTVVRFIFSFRVQMSGSERADPEELARHVHHHDCKPNRLALMERTRKNRGPRDGTLKSKACALYYDIPPAGWKPDLTPEKVAQLNPAHAGGVLQSYTNITIKDKIPSGIMVFMDKIGVAIGSDSVKNSPTERVFLAKKKEEGWKVMKSGGDFPNVKLPWPTK